MKAGYFSGAYYLGGYAVEALKACIAEAFQPRIIPDKRFVEKIYTHDLLKLVELAGLEADRVARARADSVFDQHWGAVGEWPEAARYAMVDESDARVLINALLDRDHGVFEWIRCHW